MKFIHSIDISEADIIKSGEQRSFTINGQKGSFFDLQITNAAGNFYNFITETFVSNSVFSTTSVTSIDTVGSVIYINAANANIKIGMTVTGNGIAENILVTNINSQTITLNKTADIAAGTTLKFSAKSGLNAQEISGSSTYRNKIVFPSVVSNDTYTVLLEASIINDTRLQENQRVYDTDPNSVTYGDDITQGFTNNLFNSIEIKQYVNTTITINASSTVLDGLGVDYSANTFNIEKPRNFTKEGGFKTSFSWSFTTTSASAIVKSKTPVATNFETTKTQTVNGATTNSRTVVLDSVENLIVGMKISGTGFTENADTILNIDVDNKTILVNNARSAVDGSTLTFIATGNLGPSAYGTALSFTNLTATLTPLQVTTASASTNSTSLSLVSANYIQDGLTTIIKGVGIDVDEEVVTVVTRTLVDDIIEISLPRSVEAGQVLDIEGCSSTVTITGDVILSNMGDTDFTSTLQIDDFIGIGVS